MPYTQVERLRNDSRELENYIFRMKKKGKHSLVTKLTRKRDFLNQTIAEYDENNQIQQSA